MIDGPSEMLILPSGGEWFEIASRGYRMLATSLPCTINDPKALDGRVVSVDGILYRVVAVELYLHAAPWREGEKCAFALEPMPPGR